MSLFQQKHLADFGIGTVKAPGIQPVNVNSRRKGRPKLISTIPKDGMKTRLVVAIHQRSNLSSKYVVDDKSYPGIVR